MRDPLTTALQAMALGLGLAGAGSAAATPTDAPPLAGSVAQLRNWVVGSDDNGGRPFAIIDKVAAEVFVFAANGDLQGTQPALLGMARGDDSAAGIGDRKLSDIPPDERTTPAGRFLAGFGPAAGQGEVFWIDYATAVSLHPVITTNRRERRVERLQSTSPEDNRITYGCINVSAAFYAQVVQATFRGTTGVVYILPEIRSLTEVFPALPVQTPAN